MGGSYNDPPAGDVSFYYLALDNFKLHRIFVLAPTIGRSGGAYGFSAVGHPCQTFSLNS
jgi:hypothetical protein